MATHVHGDHVMALEKMRRQMVEVVRDAGDAVQQYQRLFAASAPVEIVNTNTVRVCITID